MKQLLYRDFPVAVFWENHKIWKRLPNLFDIINYLSKKIERSFHIFVALSEILNLMHI
jgi:hypothetical protein